MSIKIEIKHRNAPEVESITLHNGWEVYRHILNVAVYDEPDLEFIALRNSAGEIVSKCSF